MTEMAFSISQSEELAFGQMKRFAPEVRPIAFIEAMLREPRHGFWDGLAWRFGS